MKIRCYPENEYRDAMSKEVDQQVNRLLRGGDLEAIDVEMADSVFVGFLSNGTVTIGESSEWEGRLYWDNLNDDQIMDVSNMSMKASDFKAMFDLVTSILGPGSEYYQSIDLSW